MKFPSWFKPRWCHPKAHIRLAAMAKIRDPETLYQIATQSRDERLRLEAAHRLNDPTLLVRLARTAIYPDIRFEAALLIRDEATLAAVALDAWHIEQGNLAVIHIDNELLLQRLVRSARQEAVRLAAAFKLHDADMIRHVARSACDIHIRWRAAKHLNDPNLLAEVACFQQSNPRNESLRTEARVAFIHHLEGCQQRSENDDLGRIVRSVAHVPFMIEAFMRISTKAVTTDIIAFLSQQDFQSADNAAIERMLNKIRQAGWKVQQNSQAVACLQCDGAGKFSLRSMTVESAHMDHDHAVCPQCDGLGQQWMTLVTCQHPRHPHIIFRLPRREPALH